MPGNGFGRLAGATERLGDIMNRRWALLTAIACLAFVAALVSAVGTVYNVSTLSKVRRVQHTNERIAKDTNGLARRAQETQISAACSLASTRKFPRLLSDNAELAKALAWSADCNKLNGVEALPIKLPPDP